MDEQQPTDAEFKSRTAELVLRAERMAAELALQNERLAETIEMFRKEVVGPLRAIGSEDHDD